MNAILIEDINELTETQSEFTVEVKGHEDDLASRKALMKELF